MAHDRAAQGRPRVLLLLSGGLDSPVAGWLLGEQGFDVGALHFSLEPFTDAAPERKCAALASRLGFAPLSVARAGPLFGELTKACDHRFYFVLSKRLMLRTACAVAASGGYAAVATGENLGQVSSQTLANLATIHAAATLPVLTPLLGWEKQEIVDVARKLDVFDIAAGPEVCDVLGPPHPRTRTETAEAEREESKLDAATLLARAIASVAPVEARGVGVRP